MPQNISPFDSLPEELLHLCFNFLAIDALVNIGLSAKRFCPIAILFYEKRIAELTTRFKTTIEGIDTLDNFFKKANKLLFFSSLEASQFSKINKSLRAYNFITFYAPSYEPVDNPESTIDFYKRRDSTRRRAYLTRDIAENTILNMINVEYFLPIEIPVDALDFSQVLKNGVINYNEVLAKPQATNIRFRSPVLIS